RERKSILRGICTAEPSQLDDDIAEAVSLFGSQEEKEEKGAKDEDRSQVVDVRQVALETARGTVKRKASGNDLLRAKKTAMVEILRNKTNHVIEYRKKEMEHKL
ncbi:Hypothetical predicted protein, partial [Paramuricea clavata]